MRNSALYHWVFYGHIWIAAAATSLSWLSLQLTFEGQDWASETPVLAFIFFATLSVYTLHRYLSFFRAKGAPTAKRYQLISKYPKTSLSIGLTSLIVAIIIGTPFISSIWSSLLWAVPITIFYLTPPIPGWRRLRDLPFVKVLWVGIAWSLMTVELPVHAMSEAINESYLINNRGLNFMISPGSPGGSFPLEVFIRLLFTMVIALLFDLRDIKLDKQQMVKTVANTLPKFHKWLTVTIILLCGILSFSHSKYLHFENSAVLFLGISYFTILPIAYYTYRTQEEDWYATVVNGFLLLPPLFYGIGYWMT